MIVLHVSYKHAMFRCLLTNITSNTWLLKILDMSVQVFFHRKALGTIRALMNGVGWYIRRSAWLTKFHNISSLFLVINGWRDILECCSHLVRILLIIRWWDDETFLAVIWRMSLVPMAVEAEGFISSSDDETFLAVRGTVMLVPMAEEAAGFFSSTLDETFLSVRGTMLLVPMAKEVTGFFSSSEMVELDEEEIIAVSIIVLTARSLLVTESCLHLLSESRFKLYGVASLFWKWILTKLLWV